MRAGSNALCQEDKWVLPDDACQRGPYPPELHAVTHSASLPPHPYTHSHTGTAGLLLCLQMSPEIDLMAGLGVRSYGPWAKRPLWLLLQSSIGAQPEPSFPSAYGCFPASGTFPHVMVSKPTGKEDPYRQVRPYFSFHVKRTRSPGKLNEKSTGPSLVVNSETRTQALGSSLF